MNNVSEIERPLQSWLLQNAVFRGTYGGHEGPLNQKDLALGYPKWEIYQIGAQVDNASVHHAWSEINRSIETDLGLSIVGKELEYLATAYGDGGGGLTDLRIPEKTVLVLSEKAQLEIIRIAHTLQSLNRRNATITNYLSDALIRQIDEPPYHHNVFFHEGDLRDKGPESFDNLGAEWRIGVRIKTPGTKGGMSSRWDQLLQSFKIRPPVPMQVGRALADRLSDIAQDSAPIAIKRANAGYVELAIKEVTARKLIIAAQNPNLDLTQVTDDPEAFLKVTAPLARKRKLWEMHK